MAVAPPLLPTLPLELEDKEPTYLQARGTKRTNAKNAHLTKMFLVFISSPKTNDSLFVPILFSINSLLSVTQEFAMKTRKAAFKFPLPDSESKLPAK